MPLVFICAVGFWARWTLLSTKSSAHAFMKKLRYSTTPIRTRH